MIYIKIILIGILATLVVWGFSELRDYIDDTGIWDRLPYNLQESITCVSILTGLILILVFIYRFIGKIV